MCNGGPDAQLLACPDLPTYPQVAAVDRCRSQADETRSLRWPQVSEALVINMRREHAWPRLAWSHASLGWAAAGGLGGAVPASSASPSARTFATR